MKFEYEGFSCDVDIFYKDHDIVVRFYDSSKEHEEDQICNLVIVEYNGEYQQYQRNTNMNDYQENY